MTHVDLLELRKTNAALRRVKELREANGLHFYRPHFKQHRFHEMGDVTGRYARAGNRGGKTKCGAAETVAWCYGGREWYRSAFDILGTEQRDGNTVTVVKGHHPGGDNHPLVTQGIPRRSVKGLLVVSAWKKAEEIFTARSEDYASCGDLFQLIPKDALRPNSIHSTQGNVDRIDIYRPEKYGGGMSILYIQTVESFKHSPLSAESSDFDFIHYDEPPPQKMFIGNKRGLTDRNGKFWINATPVIELWINDEFAPSSGTNLKVPDAGLRFQKTAKGGDRYIITWSIFDNPHINDDGREEFLSSLTREERECRANGLPLNLAGLVYKEFIYDFHVLADVPKGWADYDLPPKDYTIRVAWDVHDSTPQAILLIATAPTGESFIFDEMFFSSDIRENAVLLQEKLRERFVAAYLIDPRAKIESPVTGASILDTLMEWDFYFDLGSKDMTLGILQTREKLKERRMTLQDGVLVPMPTLWFCPTVPTLLREITRYSYSPKTSRPVDKDDHMCENLRRLILNGLDYVPPAKDSDYTRPNHTIRFDEVHVKSYR